jgi:2-phospho-L-lactate guanylyltransferase
VIIWAVVPVKPLRRAKSRLKEVLSVDQRAQLSRAMLIHTLDVLSKVRGIERTMVISRDSQALAVARDHGANTVTEHGSPELNKALVRATLVAKGYGVSSLLVLPADLPLLDVQDLEAFISCATSPPVVVIAPDRKRQGTNGLLCSPPDILDYDFGPQSFERHIERARRAGARVEICELPRFGLDLDEPEDLALLSGQGVEGLPVAQPRE